MEKWDIKKTNNKKKYKYNFFKRIQLIVPIIFLITFSLYDIYFYHEVKYISIFRLLFFVFLSIYFLIIFPNVYVCKEEIYLTPLLPFIKFKVPNNKDKVTITIRKSLFCKEFITIKIYFFFPLYFFLTSDLINYYSLKTKLLDKTNNIVKDKQTRWPL